MILAAGLGTRMRPLSLLRAKPALPVRGRPVIACLLDLLRRHGVREVVVNLHHLPQTVEEAIRRARPADLEIHYSREQRPLGTGGGMLRVSRFLRESDPAIVVAGDMLLDLDLSALVERHRRSRATCTLLLRDDPRTRELGSIGLDDFDRVRRVADAIDLGGSSRSGVFVGVRLLSPAAFESAPGGADGVAFEDLRDWFVPAVRRDENWLRACLLSARECVFEPVGTPQEYLRANLRPPRLSYLPAEGAWQVGAKVLGADADVIMGEGSQIEAGARIARSVVFEGERVGSDFCDSGGVIAAGRFYRCEEPDSRAEPSPRAEPKSRPAGGGSGS